MTLLCDTAGGRYDVGTGTAQSRVAVLSFAAAATTHRYQHHALCMEKVKLDLSLI